MSNIRRYNRRKLCWLRWYTEDGEFHECRRKQRHDGPHRRYKCGYVGQVL